MGERAVIRDDADRKRKPREIDVGRCGIGQIREDFGFLIERDDERAGSEHHGRDERDHVRRDLAGDDRHQRRKYRVCDQRHDRPDEVVHASGWLTTTKTVWEPVSGVDSADGRTGRSVGMSDPRKDRLWGVFPHDSSTQRSSEAGVPPRGARSGGDDSSSHGTA